MIEEQIKISQTANERVFNHLKEQLAKEKAKNDSTIKEISKAYADIIRDKDIKIQKLKEKVTLLKSVVDSMNMNAVTPALRPVKPKRGA